MNSTAQKLFIKAAPIVILIHLMGAIIAEYLQNKIEGIMNAPEGQSYLIWIFGSLNILSFFFLSLIVLALCFYFISEDETKNEIGPHFAESLGPLAKEGLRSYGKAGLWALLLIIPGVVRYLQLSLVPFVVILDPAYKAGQRDALKTSTQLVNQNFMAVIAIEVFIAFGLSFLLTGVFSQWTSFAQTPIAAIVLTVLQSFVFLLSFWLLFKVYQRAQASPLA